jgi:hypothetical protein
MWAVYALIVWEVSCFAALYFLKNLKGVTYSPISEHSLNPNSAVEKSGGRNLGRYGVEKWDGGNDLVGMVWGLVANSPFQLRRNRESVRYGA